MRETLQMESTTIMAELTQTLEPMLNARRLSCITEFEKKYTDEVAAIQKRNVEMEMEIPKLKKRLYVPRHAAPRRVPRATRSRAPRHLAISPPRQPHTSPTAPTVTAGTQGMPRWKRPTWKRPV